MQSDQISAIHVIMRNGEMRRLALAALLGLGLNIWISGCSGLGGTEAAATGASTGALSAPGPAHLLITEVTL
ncbi:MAG: hypothetical protein AAGC55_15775, partial [Myxococcota bacterium]